MAKRTYLQSALNWIFAIGILVSAGWSGYEIWFYFAKSVDDGVMIIDFYEESTYCDSTEWGVGIPCCTKVNFHVTEDLFWYPVNYDPWGRSTPFETDGKIKDWKLERSWGSGWRNIPMDKGCTGTWCGGKRWGAVYSVAWREGKDYETRICAIKENPTDYITWGFGIFNATWLGKNIIGYEVGYYVEPDQKKIIFIPGFNCSNHNPRILCDSCYDGNCDGTIDSGESHYVIDIIDWSISSRLDTKSLGEIRIEG